MEIFLSLLPLFRVVFSLVQFEGVLPGKCVSPQTRLAFSLWSLLGMQMGKQELARSLVGAYQWQEAVCHFSPPLHLGFFVLAEANAFPAPISLSSVI